MLCENLARDHSLKPRLATLSGDFKQLVQIDNLAMQNQVELAPLAVGDLFKACLILSGACDELLIQRPVLT